MPSNLAHVRFCKIFALNLPDPRPRVENRHFDGIADFTNTGQREHHYPRGPGRRTVVKERQHRLAKQWAIPSGSFPGAKNLALSPRRRSVFPRKFLTRYSGRIHPWLREVLWRATGQGRGSIRVRNCDASAAHWSSSKTHLFNNIEGSFSKARSGDVEVAVNIQPKRPLSPL